MASIESYNDAAHRAQVLALWREVFGYSAAHNDPELSLGNKLAHGDGLLFVALDGAQGSAQVLGTAMAGYDGHRGWLYSIAVHPERRRLGLGAALVQHAEQALVRLGCVKINLQLLASNEATVAFYQRLGYAVEPRISMGRGLITRT